uniref:COP9 signalosome complex subunit 5 n=1 Tax=Brassica oleracea var. oleracea TaxID=109376 RepID=A0A0D3D788_BRAOL
MESSSTIARKTWELENNILTVKLPADSSSDNIFHYDGAAHAKVLKEKTWATNPNYFKRVQISALALLKMVVHARSGSTIEIWVLCRGKQMAIRSLLWTLLLCLLKELRLGLMLRPMRMSTGSVYNSSCFVDYYCNLNHRLGDWRMLLGGITCILGMDAGSRVLMFQHRCLTNSIRSLFLAVVIDPTRTVSAGKVEIGAFRTYPEGHKISDDHVSEYQTIPLNKIEDFGVHCKQYYSLDITYFKSSLDSHLLELLWNKYWVNTLSSSPLVGNGDYIAGQISDLGK